MDYEYIVFVAREHGAGLWVPGDYVTLKPNREGLELVRSTVIAPPLWPLAMEAARAGGLHQVEASPGVTAAWAWQRLWDRVDEAPLAPAQAHPPRPSLVRLK